MKPVDLHGRVFGKLTVLSRGENNQYGKARWLCLCECGVQKQVLSATLIRGESRSCGCSMPAFVSAGVWRHGRSARNDPTYFSWASMLSRCRNPKAVGFSRYGGRGVTVCDRWAKFTNFLADMGERIEGTTIDRINNDGNYEPSNCRWATRKEQIHNSTTPMFLTLGDVTLNQSDWARKIGISQSTLHGRLKKWPLEKALLTPKLR